MSKLHFILQGKGGCGKSTNAVFLAQYLKTKTENLICLDTDPNNDTFSEFENLGVLHFPIEEEINGEIQINPRAFDGLIEQISTNDNTYVIDNGSSTYSPLINYFIKDSVLDLLKDELNKEVYIHVPIGGGAAEYCAEQLIHLVNQFGGAAKIIVWENYYWGELNIGSKKYSECEPIKKIENDIFGKIIIKKEAQNTAELDMRLMLENNLTFDEVFKDNSKQFSLMSKTRLRKLWTEITAQLDNVLFPTKVVNEKVKSKKTAE